MKIKKVTKKGLVIVEDNNIKCEDICFIVDDEDRPVGTIVNNEVMDSVDPVLMLIHDALTTELAVVGENENGFEVGILPYQDKYLKLFVGIENGKALLRIPSLTDYSFELKEPINIYGKARGVITKLIEDKVITSDLFLNIAIAADDCTR